uniref:protein O-GlcNAc transferase n=1 Tax=Oryza meridionalis TaxID=40149 RepID=A0A0E0CKN1_9ORYZ
MLSLQQQGGVGDPRPQQPALLGGADWLGFGRAAAELDESVASSPASFLLPSAPPVDARAQAQPEPKPKQLGAVDVERHLALAHQNYRSGKYKEALEHGNIVYEKNPWRTDNLLLLGAIYYQIRNYDMCIAKNEEALAIDPNFAECYGNMANAWKEKGDVDLAIRYYLTAIQVDAHSNLGNLMKAQGFIQEAYNCYIEALRIDPQFAIAWSNLAGLFMEAGDLDKALLYYKEAVKLKPSFADAYLNQGNVYKAMGMSQEAIISYQRAVQARPDYAMAYGNLATIYYEQGQLDIAIRCYNQAIICDPQFVEAYNNMGNVLKDAGRVEEAINCYRSCLALQANHPQALTNLGNIYMEWNLISAAASFYKAAISVTSGLSSPLNNLAVIYKQQGNYADAITCYTEVLRVDPTAADALVNRGNTFKEIGRVNEAIQDYIQAATIRPTMAEAHANLASAYKDSGHVETAIVSYKQALRLRPDFPEATCNLLHTLQCVCDWENRNAIRKYAAHCSLIASRFGLPSFVHPPPVPVKAEGKHCRLRVGYVSSDFGNHPLSHLMGSVFGMHDRDNVEVFCYALSQNDGTEWRQRIQSEAEHFVDVSAMTSDMIARIINQDKIQILINLNGYTKGARNEIFALQPAPIQVSYMGFPGTTGAAYIDYLVTDEKNRDCLDPVCPHKRSDYGLPEDKFIFACFNQLYKMDPEIFDTWCNILKRVPNSALWLLRFPAAGETRVRAHAAARGVRPDQIIFTDVAMKNEHIRRSSLADLFLDTPLCNAHTTGTDILWAGLPMITLPLEKMATRVAGSLCLATGLGEEMIYEDRAVDLALNPAKLQALTNKLKEVRMTCPLFDTARWVRNLERAYYKMWNLYCSGRHREPFKVIEDDNEFPYDR